MADNIFFTNVEQRGDNVFIRFIDSNGNRHKKKIAYKPELYINSNTTSDMLSVKGEHLSKVEFNSIKESKEFIEKYKEIDGFRIYGQRAIDLQFIAKYFKDEIKYNPDHIRYCIIDIEVFSGSIDIDGIVKAGPFPEPEEAKYPISAITLYDSIQDKYHVFGLEVFDGKFIGTFDISCLDIKDQRRVQDLNIEYYPFDSETKLLHSFLDKWEELSPDLYSGWNSDGFDTVYIINRIKSLLGETAPKRLSPWGMINERRQKDTYGNEVQRYIIFGCPNIDYRELVEKHGFISPDNWKLGTVADVIIGEGKIDYSEADSLNTLYVTNYNKYISYNAIDVNLIVKMEQKKSFIGLTYALAYLYKCNYADTTATVKPISAYAYNTLLNKGMVPALQSPQQKRDIIGGFVKEPTPGKYRWIMTLDASSLYPHMMMAYSMGPETILDEDKANLIRRELIQEIDQLISSHENLEQRKYLGKVKHALMTNSLMHEFWWDVDDFFTFETLKKYNVGLAPNCALFDRSKTGLWGEICEYVYARRKAVKKEMLLAEQKLIDLKSSGNYTNEQIKELEAEIATKQNLQMGLKILMNGAYGALSNEYLTDYFDQRIAEAITSSGQVGIQFISKKMNDYMNAIMKTKGISYVIMNDTDSLGVWFDPLVNKLFGDKYEIIKVVDFLDKLASEKLQPMLNKWTEELSKSFNQKHNKLDFKREKIGDVGIWTKKKRYVVSVWDSEGVRYTEPKIAITGLEAVRSTYKKVWRDWLKESYMTTLYNDNESAIHAKVKEVESAFKKIPLHEIATVISCNDIEKYQVGEFAWGKGATMQVKAALNYRKLVAKYDLNLPEINSGDKILMLKLIKNNPFGMDVIGFPEYLPKEFKMENYVDYNQLFNKNYLDPMEGFLTAVGWSPKPKASTASLFG